MIVTRDNFSSIIEKLAKSGEYGLDTETTGLKREDRLFSVIFADADDGYYFNFNDRPDHLGNRPESRFILPREWIEKLSLITENKASTFFLHNAKFDIGMLSKDGVYILGHVHCTEAMERVYHNNYLSHKPYSLASCAKRRKWAKDEAVEDYITKHKLVTKIKIPGKDKEITLKHFDLVPFDIIAPYGCTDAILARNIGLDQLEKIKKIDDSSPLSTPKLMTLVENERKLTHVCFRMEDTGVRIDRPYVKKALAHTLKEATRAGKEFQTLTGLAWEDSTDTLKKAFAQAGITLPLTATGKPCTNKAVLDALENPIADKIREIRKHLKLASTYYSSFLYFADEDDILHANIRQGGTETSRFSMSDPNLQNVPKEDEEEDRTKLYTVRRSIVPVNGDFCLVPIDFKQQEFRVMLDYAGETKMIEAIMSGVDVHDATAVMMGLVEKYGAKKARKIAKTINFGLLYGMGVPKLAKSLGVTIEEAFELKSLYFAKLPRVQKLVRGVMATGEARGYIRNWFGFRNHISSQEYAYILPNHLIQGSCAQVLRVALVKLDQFIRDNRLRSQMVLQVHDEILFQVHRSELDWVPKFRAVMESVYPSLNGMRLECSVEHSWKSWNKWDQVSGAPA